MSANPVEPDDNPNTRTVKEGLEQIRAPLPKSNAQNICDDIRAPENEIRAPLQFESEADVDILSNQTRFWRLETYVDRHGKRRARQVLRFVPHPPPSRALGQVTEKLAEELKARPGKGNWRDSRADSEQFRLYAGRIAERFRRISRLRRNRAALRRPERADNSTAERGDMQKPQDDALWADVPDVLM